VIRVARAAWRALRGIAHLLHGMGLMALRMHAWDEPTRLARVQWWSAKTLRLLGLRLQTNGACTPGPCLIVANHVSWLDIAVIHAACPRARFVAKADVRRWPLLGWFIAGPGTLFITRERKRDAVRVVHEMAQALGRGETVAIFPEGTTGTGAPVLPFHANLLQAALTAEVPVQPVALRYSDPQRRFSHAVEYVGDTTLVASFLRIVAADAVSVQVQFLAPVASATPDTEAQANRRELAPRLRDAIGRAIGEGEQ
jgi:1-acyl-sn-glycerol-3-phosphate acyltransferase